MKKSIQRVVAMVLASAVAASFMGILPATATAAGQLKVKIGTATVSKNKVSLPVKFTQNPGVAGFMFTVKYNTKRYKFTGVSGTASRLSTISCNASKGTILYYAASNFSGTGKVFKLNFTAKAGVKKGKTKVTMTASKGDVCKANLKLVSTSVSAGYILKK